MIWVRRVFAIPLIVIFLVLLIASLVVVQVNNSFADADFYNKQMRKADMYNFLYDKALPAALDEIEEEDPSDVPVHLAKVKEDTISAVRQIAPPEWLQAQFESGTKAFLPYFLGSTDKISYTVLLKERVEAAARVAKEDFLQGETFRSIYNDGMEWGAGKMAENLDQLPYDIQLSSDRIEQAITTAVPSDWIINQVGSSIDAAVPYFTKKADHFTIRIQVKDRVDVAAAVVLDLLAGEETYRYLMDEMIGPTIESNVGRIVQLPFRVNIASAEVTEDIKQVLPQSWVEGQFRAAINGIADYVEGDTDRIALTIDLADRKAVAMQVISQRADQKLAEVYNSLPVRSEAEFLQAIRNLSPNNITLFRPAGLTYEQFKSALRINIPNVVQRLIGDQIPDRWVYTDADLRKSMGVENEDLLDEVRGWVRDGWTFTDADLKDELTLDEQGTLEDVRGWIADGLTIDETDVRREIGDNNPQDLKSLDDARSAIHTVRKWMWAIAILPFVLLIGIGFLAGRGWRGRVLWAFGILFATSLIIFIALTVVNSSVVEPELEDAFEITDETGLELVMLEKGHEVAQNVADSFIGGLKSKTMWMMVFSGLALVVTIWWKQITPKVNNLSRRLRRS